jgi:hypothetical protein
MDRRRSILFRDRQKLYLHRAVDEQGQVLATQVHSHLSAHDEHAAGRLHPVSARPHTVVLNLPFTNR